MRQVSVDQKTPDPQSLAEAVRVLEAGGLVAFPTETVYGLCADASNPAAVARLYAVKGRDRERDCAYMLPDRSGFREHADELPLLARRLADRFWPGPITLVVPGKDDGMVGLRLPSIVLARSLALAAGRPLLQTSANRTGQPAVLNAQGVLEIFPEGVDLLLDGGPAPGGRSSTVVRCSQRRFSILRPGAISEEDIVRAATDLILLACTGNLCRSPLAEASLCHSLATELGCEISELLEHGFRFGSFGTMAMVDRSASDNAVVSAAEHALDLSQHRSRPFSIDLLEEARTVYCLASGHREFLAPYFRDRPGDLAMLDPKGKDIRDPYGRSLKVYRKVAEQILKACDTRAKELSSRDSRSMES